METNQFVTAEKIAACLMVSKKTIYQWAELRQIPSYKFNGSLRFKLDEILQWAETCKIAPFSGRTLEKNSNDRPNREKVQ
jgi:excisionase family DNA binding protein